MLSAHPQSPHLHPPQPAPTRASLKTWWNHFTFVQRAKKDSHFVREYEKGSEADHPVFGKPLAESLKYASVPISTANQNGDLYVWGYVPVVVAKCGLYLKENATEVPGTFRVNGANRRMRDLQLQFETPPKYGKSLDWKQETYTTHDVASVFRRYLTQMPEPVIPHRLYHKFRDALAKEPHSQDAVISEYKALIRQMSHANQYLLLYVLDLLSVFARKSDKNLMTAQNLAVIFRPGILSHPTHEMAPAEHALSQRVLEFLIANQDWFMLDTPAPVNPASFSPPFPNTTPTYAPPSSNSTPTLPPSLPAFTSTNTSSPPSTTTGVGHIGIHFRTQGGISSENGGNGDMWTSAGLGLGVEDSMMVMSEKEIQREQERIKMIRRRTTMERGEPAIYGTLEEPDMSGDSPISTTFPHHHHHQHHIPPTAASTTHGHQSSTSSSSTLLNSGGAVGVTRSRTLPSSSKTRRGGPTTTTPNAAGSNPNVNISNGGQEKDVKENHGQQGHQRERSRLLKKHNKRASMVTGPSSISTTSTNSNNLSTAPSANPTGAIAIVASNASNNKDNSTTSSTQRRISQILTGS